MGRVEHYILNWTWLTPSSPGQITCSLFIQGQCQRILGISLGMRWVVSWRYGPWVSLESLHLRKFWCCCTSIFSFPPLSPATSFSPSPPPSVPPPPRTSPLLPVPPLSLLHSGAAPTALVSAVQKAEDIGLGWWLSPLESGSHVWPLSLASFHYPQAAGPGLFPSCHNSARFQVS